VTRTSQVAVLGSPHAGEGLLDDVRTRLEREGGTIVVVPRDVAHDRVHPSDFGGLVVLDLPDGSVDPKAVQVVREFMVADRPVAVIGAGMRLLMAADAVAGRTVASPKELATDVRDLGADVVDGALYTDDKLITARSASDMHVFLERVAQSIASHVEERRIDQVSEQSFPASDPPPGPGAIGASRVGSADGDADALL
jgi:protease I